MNKTAKILIIVLAALLVISLAALVIVIVTGQNQPQNDEPTEPTLNMGNAECVHVWTAWEVTTESNCTKKGVQSRSCTLCGKEERGSVPATGHYFKDGACSACGRPERPCDHAATEEIVIKEATCASKGQANVLCTVCDAVVKVINIAPVPHANLQKVIEIEPTCVENGKAKMVCTVCGEVEHSYIIYAEGHNDTEWKTLQAPTCTENGHEQRVCHTCNTIIDERFPYSTGHQDTEWVVVKEPTCTEPGFEQQICHTCDQVIDDYAPGANGHSIQYQDAKAPTCTDTGWNRYSYCTVCEYTQYADKALPANGHHYTAGLCGTCGAEDTTFVKTEIADLPKVEHTVVQPSDSVFNAPATVIKEYTMSLSRVNEVQTFNITPAQSGNHRFWISQMHEGNSVHLVFKDELGHQVTYSNYMEDGDGCTVELTAGQTYTVQVTTRACTTAGDCVIKVGYQTATLDVSQYNLVNDAISFVEQVNHYTFTPAVDGTYRFRFTEMVSDMDVNIYVYNRLGERVGYATYLSNNEGLTVENLKAGEQYKISVFYRTGKGTYTLKIGKQHGTLDVSGYTAVHDNLYYSGQNNRYTFVAPANGNYRVELANIPNSSEVYIKLFNSLGEQVSYNNYAGNGEGFNLTNLTAGDTYTIHVSYKSTSVPYTLLIFAQKPAAELTDNTGAVDSTEYASQSNTYTFTAKKGGTYRISVTGIADDVKLCLYIYDANGNLVKSDENCRNGDTLTLTDLAPGAKYTIKISANGYITEYIISVQ
jgi:hypothetical protein